MSLNIDIESEDLMIPPMLLVTFVENCFKHGISPDEESSIDISLTEKKEFLPLGPVTVYLMDVRKDPESE